MPSLFFWILLAQAFPQPVGGQFLYQGYPPVISSAAGGPATVSNLLLADGSNLLLVSGGVLLLQ